MNYTNLFDLLIAIYGINFLYQWFRTKVQHHPFNPQCILPGDMTAKTCRDMKGFTAFILPRVLGFGIALIAYAALSFSGILDSLALYYHICFFIVAVAYYMYISKQARFQFWS